MGFSQSGNQIQGEGVGFTRAELNTFSPQIGTIEGKTTIVEKEVDVRIINSGRFIDETGNFAIIVKHNGSFGVPVGGTGYIRIGKKEVINDTNVYSKGGLILFDPYQNSSNVFRIGYCTDGSMSHSHIIGNDADFDIYGTTVILDTQYGGNTNGMCFSNIGGCIIKSNSFDYTKGNRFIVLKAGGSMDDTEMYDFYSMYITGEVRSFKNNTFVNLKGGFNTSLRGDNIRGLRKIVSANFTGGGLDAYGRSLIDGLHFVDILFDGKKPTLERLSRVTQHIDYPFQQGDATHPQPSHQNSGVHHSCSHYERLVDVDDNPVTDAVVWFKDNASDLADVVYNYKESTTSVSDRVYTPSVSATGTYYQEIQLIRSDRVSNAGKVDKWRDFLPVRKAVYGYKYVLQAEKYDTFDSFTKIGGKDPAPNIVLLDSLISEPDENIALSYTTQDTPRKAYDHLKALLTRDYDGEPATYVTRQGDILICTGLDVVVDGQGSGESSVSGGVLTLNASRFHGSLHTDRTIALKNGAYVTGVRTDINGIRSSFSISFNGVLEGSRITVFNYNKGVLFSQVVSSSEIDFNIPDGYTGGIYWTVKKQGHASVVGSSIIYIGQNVFSVHVEQLELRNTNGVMYTGISSDNISTYYAAPNARITVKDDVTVQAVFNDFEDFLATESGAKWLLENPDGGIRYDISLGGADVLSWRDNVKWETDGGSHVLLFNVLSSHDKNYIDVSLTGGALSFSGVTNVALSEEDRNILNSVYSTVKGVSLNTQRRV